jgi:mRNA interferase MazF
MIQGDVCYYTFKAPDKRRPCVILTRSILIPEFNAITIAPITTTIRNADSQVALNELDGMREDCVVNLASIQTVPKEKLGSLITHLSPERMREIKQAIEFTFGFGLL